MKLYIIEMKLSILFFHIDEMFWNRFYNLCETNKIKPSQVVKNVSIPVGSITAWKKGTEPNTQALKKIADFFNTSIDYLLERDELLEASGTEEEKLLKNYRASDTKGKERIEYTAEIEAQRSRSELKSSAS